MTCCLLWTEALCSTSSAPTTNRFWNLSSLFSFRLKHFISQCSHACFKTAFTVYQQTYVLNRLPTSFTQHRTPALWMPWGWTSCVLCAATSTMSPSTCRALPSALQPPPPPPPPPPPHRYRSRLCNTIWLIYSTHILFSRSFVLLCHFCPLIFCINRVQRFPVWCRTRVWLPCLSSPSLFASSTSCLVCCSRSSLSSLSLMEKGRLSIVHV